MSKIYIFYHINNEDKRIIVAAETYLEAKNTVFDINNYAAQHYNFTEYKIEPINAFQYLDIDPMYSCLPYVLTEAQYQDIQNKIKLENKASNIERKENDQSEKYNSAVLLKNKSIQDSLRNINKRNYSIDIKQDCELLTYINNNLFNIVGDYVYAITNLNIRNEISNDIEQLMNKYKKMIDKYNNSLESFTTNLVHYDANEKQFYINNNNVKKLSNGSKRLKNQIEKDINKVLERYIGKYNTKNTREDIENDVHNIYLKYMNKNNILDKLKENIKGDD